MRKKFWNACSTFCSQLSFSMTSYSTRLNDTLSPRNDNIYIVPHHKLTKTSTIVSVKIRTRDLFFKDMGKSRILLWQIRSVFYETLPIRHFYFVKNVFKKQELLCKNLKIWKNEWDHPQMQYNICMCIPNVIKEFSFVLWLFTQRGINILAYQVGHISSYTSFWSPCVKTITSKFKRLTKRTRIGAQ